MRITKAKVAGGLFAAAVGVALIPVGGGGGTALADTAAIPAAALENGTLNCSQLEALWEEAGGNPAHAFLAAEVAMAESSGQQYASLLDGNGTTDIGYWQINTSHGALATFDALGNARAAVQISGNGADWSPWVTYQHGAEIGKC